MIKRIETPSKDILAFSATKKLTRNDYIKHIEPELELARKEGIKLRFLFHLGENFKGFTAGAAWEDFRVGLHYVNTISSCALVSDIGWIRNVSRFIGSMIPCTVKIFKNSEFKDAIAWLNSGAIGLEHEFDRDRKLLTVEIKGPLSSESLEILSSTVDPWIREHGALQGLVIHAKTFPGWENFGSLIRHIQFVKNHHRQIRRVALAVDGAFAELAPKFGSHFVEAKIKKFEYLELKAAQNWASGS